MEIQVKVFVSLSVDTDEYPMPSDGDITDEFSDALREYIHDISGAKIKHIRISQENKHDE